MKNSAKKPQKKGKKRTVAKAITNADLSKQLSTLASSMKAVQDWMSVHEVADNTRFQESNDLSMRLSDGIFNADGTEKLATKEDVKEVLEVFGNIERGAIFVQAGGKWTFRALILISMAVAALVTIFNGWPVVIQGIFGKPMQ